MADNIQEGDKVSWNWNGNQPSGTVGEVKPGKVTVTSHRGNEISKTGNESNPAVHIERSGNDVVKKASELNIEEKVHGSSEAKERKDESSKPQENGTEKENQQENYTAEQTSANAEKEDEAKPGEKRKADEKVDADADEKVDADENETGERSENVEKEAEQGVKKQKTATNGAAEEGKKAPGRPKSNGEKKSTAKKEKKIPAVGKSERKTRSQGAA